VGVKKTIEFCFNGNVRYDQVPMNDANQIEDDQDQRRVQQQ
jgi:hypothetical protein